MKCYDRSINLSGDHFRYPEHYKVMPPSADFSASPLSGPVPLEVSFTDESSGCATAWSWMFDNGRKTVHIHAKHPTYIFEDYGRYDVSLIAYEYGKSVSITKSNFIVVSTPFVFDKVGMPAGAQNIQMVYNGTRASEIGARKYGSGAGTGWLGDDLYVTGGSDSEIELLSVSGDVLQDVPVIGATYTAVAVHADCRHVVTRSDSEILVHWLNDDNRLELKASINPTGDDLERSTVVTWVGGSYTIVGGSTGDGDDILEYDPVDETLTRILGYVDPFGLPIGDLHTDTVTHYSNEGGTPSLAIYDHNTNTFGEPNELIFRAYTHTNGVLYMIAPDQIGPDITIDRYIIDQETLTFVYDRSDVVVNWRGDGILIGYGLSRCGSEKLNLIGGDPNDIVTERRVDLLQFYPESVEVVTLPITIIGAFRDFDMRQTGPNTGVAVIRRGGPLPQDEELNFYSVTWDTAI